MDCRPNILGLPAEIRLRIFELLLVCAPRYSIGVGDDALEPEPTRPHAYDASGYWMGNSDSEDSSGPVLWSSETDHSDDDEVSDISDGEVEALLAEQKHPIQMEMLDREHGESETDSLPSEDNAEPSTLELFQAATIPYSQENNFRPIFCECTGSFAKSVFRPVALSLSAQLLRVCRQFYREGVDLLYGRNRFLISDMDSIHRRMVRKMTPATLERIKWVGLTEAPSLSRLDYSRDSTDHCGHYAFAPQMHCDSSCWYPLRNLRKLDLFLYWDPESLERPSPYANKGLLQEARSRGVGWSQGVCCGVEATARFLAARVAQGLIDEVADQAAYDGHLHCEVFLTPKYPQGTEITVDEDYTRSLRQKVSHDLAVYRGVSSRTDSTGGSDEGELATRGVVASRAATFMEQGLKSHSFADDVYTIRIDIGQSLGL